MGLGRWTTSCPEALDWDFGWFLKKTVEIWSWTKRIDFWTWARPVQLWTTRCPRVVGSDGTVSIVKIVSLSSRVERLKFKKVIKVSYLNYRESSVFRVFRDSYAYERFTDPYNLRISLLWLCYTVTLCANTLGKGIHLSVLQPSYTYYGLIVL